MMGDRGLRALAACVYLQAVLGVLACRQEARSVREGDLEFTKVYSFAPVTPDEASVYFRVRNLGTLDDTLGGASAVIAASATLHGVSTEGGTRRMAHLEQIPLPAGGSIVLEPGGTHLMLMHLTRQPQSGDSVAVDLQFRRHGKVRLMVPVRPYGTED
jgi:copper(I)-binding protein